MESRKIIGIDARGLEGNRTGVGRYLSNLLREWSLEDLGVTFLLYFKESVPKDIPLVAWIETRVLTSKSNALWTHWKLPRALRRDGVTILFAPWYIAPVALMRNIPFIITLHDVVFEACPKWVPPADRLLLRWVARHSARRAAKIVTISEFSKSEILRLYNVSSESVVVTPLAVDPSFLENVGVSSVDMREPFILFVGSLFNRRHVPAIIKAIVQSKLKMNLLIVGADHTYPPEHIDALIEKANEKMGREIIQRVDSLTEQDLAATMQEARLLISLSSYEGFNLPPLEAQTLGTPVLLADTAVAREVFGESAFYVQDPDDVYEIQSMMKNMLRDSEIVEEHRVMGKENAKRFSWQQCAKKTLAVLCSRR